MKEIQIAELSMDLIDLITGKKVVINCPSRKSFDKCIFELKLLGFNTALCNWNEYHSKTCIHINKNKFLAFSRGREEFENKGYCIIRWKRQL